MSALRIVSLSHSDFENKLVEVFDEDSFKEYSDVCKEFVNQINLRKISKGFAFINRYFFYVLKLKQFCLLFSS